MNFTSVGGWCVLAIGITGALGFALFFIAERGTNNKKEELMRELDGLVVNVPIYS